MSELTIPDTSEPSSVPGADKVKFCPGCGGVAIHFDPNLLDQSDHPDNPVFDICCISCGWTGDVSPDLPLGGSA